MAFLFVLHATVQKLRAVCNVTENVSYVDAQHGSIFFFISLETEIGEKR